MACERLSGGIKEYFIRGLKLWLVLILGILVMLIPGLIRMMITSLNQTIGIILYILFFLVGLTIDGFLITKFQCWIFK